MTVRYASKFATNSSLGSFTKLLFRWCGSVYKLIWAEYALFITLYYIINFIYRFSMNEDQQKFFEKVANFCEKSKETMEMSFILGFFVSSIVQKWWDLYNTIPWPDPVALFVNANIRGQDEPTKLLRKTIVRYCGLSLMLTFRTISPAYRRRYPTLDHLKDEGMLTEIEKINLEEMGSKNTNQWNDWLPISWATELVVNADIQGRVYNSACQRIIYQLDKFRHGLALLLEYEHCSVPLAYIQVVTISVYTYFFSCLFGRQWLIRDEHLMNLDLYFPFLTTLDFIFYVGWLKVAESLINPFGNDDDDFELDEIVNRHVQVIYSMVSATDTATFISGHDAQKCTATETHFVNEDKRNLERTPPPDFSDVMLLHSMNGENCETVRKSHDSVGACQNTRMRCGDHDDFENEN